MKIFRYNTISCLPNVMKLEEIRFSPHQKFTDSLADVSYFTPTSESVRNLRAGDVDLSPYYDFADGKDTGMEFPLSRDRRSDIAVVSNEAKKQAKELTEKLADAKAVSDRIKAYQSSKFSQATKTGSTSSE